MDESNAPPRAGAQIDAAQPTRAGCVSGVHNSRKHRALSFYPRRSTTIATETRENRVGEVASPFFGYSTAGLGNCRRGIPYSGEYGVRGASEDSRPLVTADKVRVLFVNTATL